MELPWDIQLILIFCAVWKTGLMQNNVRKKNLDFEITTFVMELNEKFLHVIWIILTGCDVYAGNITKGNSPN